MTRRASRLASRLPILIRVIDQGPGVSEADAKKLFQPFQQVNAAADKKQGGTGLGLALVRYLAREHNGIAWLEWSREGVGSCFSLLLPLRLSDTLPEEEDDAHGTFETEIFKKSRVGWKREGKHKDSAEHSSGYQNLGLSQTEASVYGLRGLQRQGQGTGNFSRLHGSKKGGASIRGPGIASSNQGEKQRSGSGSGSGPGTATWSGSGVGPGSGSRTGHDSHPLVGE